MDGILWWVVIGVGALAGILALVTAIGALLPKRHVASRAVRLKQPPEEVWKVVTDFAAAPAWHRAVQQVERLADKDGHEVWRETYAGGYPIVLETKEAVPPRRLVRSIADESGPFTGRWEFALSPEDGGTRVTLTEHGEVRNPFFRFMARAFMDPAAYLELYLKALADRFGEPAVIEKVGATEKR